LIRRSRPICETRLAAAGIRQTRSALLEIALSFDYE